MPEPNWNLSILEGFLAGDPISDHHGVRCRPAMREQTEEKYILKTVSVPASQDKLDAMLLAGAFPDRDAALAYFKGLSQDTEKEAELLQRLSQLEGFLPYESWETAEKENGTGFEVHLLSPYRPTLERCLRSSALTHLEAINLGLDLCAALAVCRRSGYLYVDLKPSNIFVCEDHEYRIADLGFLPLVSLPYASLPEKYHSSFTAPEIADAYSPLNATLDIYAAGLVLYQVYNNGALPRPTEDGTLLPPEYADYEMAEIILTACHPDPAKRWQDPAQMGQALVSYLQKNTVNDTPITPPVLPVEADPVPETPPVEAEPEDPTTDELLSQVDQALESVGVDPQAAPEAPAAEEPSQEKANAPDAPLPENPEDAVSPVPAVDAAEEIREESPEASQEKIPQGEVTDEVSQILAQADDLIAHETPEGVVAPQPIEVPIPPKIVPPADPKPEAADGAAPLSESSEDPALPITEPEEAADEPDPAESAPAEADAPNGKGLITVLVSLIVAAVLFLGSYVFYTQYYQQAIDGIELYGREDQLTVKLNTDISDALLTVVCTDAYGNTKRQTVTDKTAVFSGLTPNTRYKVQVEIFGFHQLTGITSGVHITQEQTSILNLSAVAGAESGSAILSFTVMGPEPELWRLTYYADGEEEKSVTFSGHVATVTGLVLGKHYSFQLSPTEQLYIVGSDTLEFTASKLIFPQDLTILGFTGNALAVQWHAPEGETVESWNVRCFNETGFDKTVTVTQPAAVFEELDPAAAYTVEVCAFGMSQGSRVSVSANSVTVNNLTADTSNPAHIKLSWKFEGNAPAGGWTVLYSVSGLAEPLSVSCPDPYVEITPLIPGCSYTFTVQATGGNTVFGGSLSYTAPEAKTFSGYGVSAENMQFSMCRTPNKEAWTKKDLSKKDYTTEFATGESASFAIDLNREYETSSDKIVTLYLIRDTQGNILSSGSSVSTWTNMWYKGFGTLTLPTMPQAAGSYTVDIFFNGSHVIQQSFTVI